MLLRNHGTLTVGRTCAEAFFLMFQLIAACNVQVHAISSHVDSLSNVVVVPEAIVTEKFGLAAAPDVNYTGKRFGEREWECMVRRLERMIGNAYKV